MHMGSPPTTMMVSFGKWKTYTAKVRRTSKGWPVFQGDRIEILSHSEGDEKKSTHRRNCHPQLLACSHNTLDTPKVSMHWQII